MSAFQDLASSAPEVEAAEASRPQTDKNSDDLEVEPARPCEDATVEAATAVDAAVPFDNPKEFAPPMSQETASHLSVAALRAGSGADFASKAAVIKGRVERNFLRRWFPCVYDERDFVAFGEVARFLFVKGNCIFVYGQETDPNPLYAIQLESVVAMQEDPKNPDADSFTISPRINTNEARENLVTVLLKDRTTRKQSYQITFDTSKDNGVAKRFIDVLAVNAKHYGGEVITASVVQSKTTCKTISK